MRWSCLVFSWWSGGPVVQPSDVKLDDNRTADGTALFERTLCATVVMLMLCV